MSTAQHPGSAGATVAQHDGRRSWARFAGVAFALGVLVVGTNLPTPLYGVYERRFGFSALALTAVFAVYCAALIPSLLVCGPLADALGARRVVLPGLAVAAAGSAVLSLATGTAWLYAGRALQGVATGATSGALTAALVQTEPRANRARASLLASAVLCAGAGIGPILAGALAQYAPAPERLAYIVEIALLVLAGAASTSLPAGPAEGANPWALRRPRVPAGSVAGFVQAGAVSALAWAVAALFLALVPSYATALLHTASLLVAGASAGVLLICAAASQLVLPAWGYRRAERVGVAMLASGAAGLLGAGVLASLPMLLVAVGVAGAGLGLAFMGALRQANDIAAPSERAGLLAAFYVVTYVGEGLPVIAAGYLAAQLDLVTGVSVVLGVVVAVCIAALVALCIPSPPDRQRKRPARARLRVDKEAGVTADQRQ